MIQIFQSSSSKQRLAAAADFVRSFPPGTELLLLGSTREATDDFVRDLSAAVGSTFGLHRFTLTQLAARLAEEVFATEGSVPCTGLASNALATRAKFEVLSRGGMQYLEGVAGFPGFARTLASTLTELRAAGVASELLQNKPAPAPELATLLTEYRNQMVEGGLADRVAFLEVARDTLLEAVPNRYAGLPTLFLDVPVESKIERDFVDALALKALQVFVTLPTGDESSLAAFAEIGSIEEAIVDDTGQESSLFRLRRYLFSPEAPARASADDQVRFFSAPGEAREAVEVARYLLDEARSGVRFDEMAVFLRAPETYSPLLQTALRRAGIPAYFARGTKRPDPSGRAFLALLDCASEDLSAKRFAEYLSFAQVPQLEESGGPPQGRGIWVGPGDELRVDYAATPQEATEELGYGEDGSEDTEASPNFAGTLRAPWKWEELLVEASVIGGAERWKRRLAGLGNELRARLEEWSAEEPDSPRIARIQREIANLNHLKAFALPLIDELAAFPQEATWGEWIERLTTLAQRVLRRPERVLRTLAELQPMAVVGPVAIDEVREVLLEPLSFLEEDPPPSRYGRVFVATPDQARGRKFKVVFVLGLAERMFPQPPREDPLLLDGLRAEITEDLPNQEDRSRRERLFLQLAVGAVEDRVYLSYPRVDVIQSRPRVTSFYGLDVARAITGSIPGPEQLERDAATLAGTRLAWPAPLQPDRAIDSSEHDLSVLWQLLHEKTSSKAAGRARYLLELNDHLGRSLRSRFMRWERKTWSRCDGLVQNAPNIEPVLATQRLAARPYSAGALEKYSACPYRFLLSAIFGLEPREEAVALERLDPLTRGRLFHQIQFEGLRAFQREGLLPLTTDNLSEAEDSLLRTLREVAEQFREEIAPPISRVWQDEIAEIRTDLLSWLRRFVEQVKFWRPQHFEFAFGLPPGRDRDPESHSEPARLDDGVILRGAVDLIECDPDGQLRVTDYKTGANRTPAGLVIGGGETLQPVLYGLAIEAVLEKPVSEARLFFCTSRGGFSEHIVPLGEKAHDQGRKVLRTIDRAIENGVLPPAPREGACGYCEFRVVCGPWEEERTGRKDPGLIKDLLALRAQP